MKARQILHYYLQQIGLAAICLAHRIILHPLLSIFNHVGTDFPLWWISFVLDNYCNSFKNWAPFFLFLDESRVIVFDIWSCVSTDVITRFYRVSYHLQTKCLSVQLSSLFDRRYRTIIRHTDRRCPMIIQGLSFQRFIDN